MRLTAADPVNIPQTIDDDGTVRTTIFSHTHQSSVITVERWDYPPSTAQPWHDHPEPKSGHIVSGEMTIEVDGGGLRKLTPFDPFYIFAGQRHRFLTTCGTSLYVMIATGHPAHGRMRGWDGG